MDVAKIHPDYDTNEKAWRKCRDAVFGQRAIQEGGELYLPKLSGQAADSYQSYLMRGVYYNATGRTVQALLGLAFRKPASIEVAAGMEDWLDDINLSGLSLIGLAKHALKEVIVAGRGGLLVDHNNPAGDAGEVMTIEQARRQAVRPYITYYTAENIIYWEMGRVNNITRPVLIVLREFFEDTDGETKEQRRALTYLENTYVQEIYRETEAGWVMVDTITPRQNSQEITEIPFYFLGPDEDTVNVQKPPIEDLADINIAHFRNSADLENGAHIAGQPTPYISGDVDEKFTFHLGQAGIIAPSGTEIDFLQCGSEGFASLEKLMQSKEQQMAALGARMLSPEKSGVEAAETLAIKRGGENAALGGIVGSVEAQIEKALQFMADWAGLSGDVRFEMNKDYLPYPMSAQQLTALLGTVQSGYMSEQSFFEALKAGEIIADDIDFEDEQERIADSAPALGVMDDSQ